MRQLDLKLGSGWGGKRAGAGRPRKLDELPHVPRPKLASRFPVHVTWKMTSEVWNLRSRRSERALAPAFWKGAVREGFRLVHFAVMGNHMHLIIEAGDEKKLANGLKALGVRVARALNRMMGRQGRVIRDRYHAHILKTPAEVRKARNYQLNNAKNHYGWEGPDRYTSQRPLAAPHTWLLRMHC